MTMSFEKRFWAKVDRRGADECWPWTASVNNHGYGRISTTRAAGPVFAHRASYALANGALSEGQIVCHRCDNPRCVNPAHLYAGSYAQNTADMMSRGRHRSARITACPKGHRYAPGSFYVYRGRQCRICSIERASEKRRRRAINCDNGANL